MRVTERQRAAMKATRMRELRPLGYKSDIFQARYAGRCAASGIQYPVGEPVCFFGEHVKPVLATIASQLVEKARHAAAPKCGCGKEATVEPANRSVSGSPYTLCTRCDWICEYFFGEIGREVTRDSKPEI